MELKHGLMGTFALAALGCVGVHFASSFLAATVLPFDPLTTASSALTDTMVQALA